MFLRRWGDRDRDDLLVAIVGSDGVTSFVEGDVFVLVDLFHRADAEKSRLEPNPATTPVIQRIYRDLANGKSALSIAHDLTAEQVPTPSGRNRHWRSESIRDMVKRPYYCGRAIGWVNRELTSAAQYVDVPDSNPLPADTFPALVSVETWERANRELKVRHISQLKESGRKQTALLVGGFIRCAYCGRPMCTKWWMRQVQMYACNGRHGE